MSIDLWDFTKGFTLEENPQLDEFLDRTSLGINKMRGAQVGPFDHPDGLAQDEPFTLAHSLGEAPDTYLSIEDPGVTGAGVYAREEDRLGWNEETITLRSPDVNNRQIRVRIFPRSGE